MATRNTNNPNEITTPPTSEEMSDSVKIGGDVKISGDSHAPTVIGNNNNINIYPSPSSDISSPKKAESFPKRKPIDPKPQRKSLVLIYYSAGALLIIVTAALFGGNIFGGEGGAGSNSKTTTLETQLPPAPANPPSDSKTMLEIPGGDFTMGSDVISNAAPASKVNVPAFKMDKTEVTNEMYAVCVQAGSCEPPKNTTYYDNAHYAHHPVVYITWYEAKAYCEWTGKRLPSEAEWEKAARDNDGRTYPWGYNLPDTSLLNYMNQGTLPVGNFPKGESPYHVLDMAGNVWEWTASLDIQYPYRTDQNREDPNNTGPRIIRGGSWRDDADAVRSAVRYGYSPNIYLDNLGFRCVK